MATFLLILTVTVMLFAVISALRGFWAVIDERSAVAQAAHATETARDHFWQGYGDLAGTPIGVQDFREAGWSDARARGFLAERFPGRDEIRLDELRPFTNDDVMVQDVVRYRDLRRRAAERFGAIRFTWINVEHEEEAGKLPAALLRFVTSQERQSGRLVLVSDLLPFVGRPLIYELLEKKLADCNVTPASETRH